MQQEQEFGASASPPLSHPFGAEPVPVSGKAGIANAGCAYEAMVYSAHLPMRTIAFIYRDGEPRLAGGIFRIERVRSATEQDHQDFKCPPEGICPLCGQVEADS